MNFVLMFFVLLWSTYRLSSNNPFPSLRCVDWAPWVTARMPQLFGDVHCPSLTGLEVHIEKCALQWEMHFCNTEDRSCFLLPLGPLVTAALQGELAGSAPRVSASVARQGWLPARSRLLPPAWLTQPSVGEALLECLCPAYASTWISLWPLIFMLQHSPNSFQGVKFISDCAFFAVCCKNANRFIRTRAKPCRTSWLSARMCNFCM